MASAAIHPVGESTIVVFAGTGALGSAICRRLAASWGTVAFTCFGQTQRAEALAGDLSSSCGSKWVRADVRKEVDVLAALDMADDTHPLGGVIFAAGADIEQPFVSQIDQRTWDDVVDLELKGFMRVVRLALPALRRTRGVLVSVGSFATHRFPPGDAISAVPKAGMEVLTRAVAREEGRYGIRANTVAPGIIDDGLGKAVQEKTFTREIWEEQRRRVPLRRFGAAAEVADAVDFLTSDRASYITGQTIMVDGGLHI
jgi:NAD(P)-dependent dehydrogenase (short-subunit alcohol dehydrogenase family)